MLIQEFALLVIIISASGAMAPGPLFAANISYGLRGGIRAGLKMAIGHTIVELPLVVLLGIGVLSLESFPEFRIVITVLGAITLFGFAILQITKTYKTKEEFSREPKQGPLITGIALSALNPFFLMWWLTIGFKLISEAMEAWSFVGILIMFGLHIWLDFAWLGATAYFASKANKILSNRNYKFLMLGLSVMMIYFGITFVTEIF